MRHTNKDREQRLDAVVDLVDDFAQRLPEPNSVDNAVSLTSGLLHGGYVWFESGGKGQVALIAERPSLRD